MIGRALAVALGLAVSLAACNTLVGPSPGPEPTPAPTNPPGTAEEEVVFSGNIAASDEPTCEPFPEFGFRVCRTFTVTPGADGLLDYTFEWSPAEPAARNAFAFHSNCIGTSHVGASPTPTPSGSNGIASRPVKASQPCAIAAYIYPHGEGRSNFTLRVKYPK